MTKKEYCLMNPTIAVSSDFGGIECHGIEYGIEDYLYLKIGVLCDNPKYHSYHKLKIRYNSYYNAYVKLCSQRLFLNEFESIQ